ncbi:hypothetical protein [Sphingomonas lenta]|nr:hypothetical protein [Sphingomonas lenta]
MAPDLALDRLVRLQPNSIVLDPMTGSGTVIQQACAAGHRAIGVDVDPLAVMLSRVSAGAVDDRSVDLAGGHVASVARRIGAPETLEWIDEDAETTRFVEFWFAPRQRDALRRLARVIADLERETPGAMALDVLRLALSRLIIVKENGASLARDTAHSRPHRVALDNDFDVVAQFDRSVAWVRRRLRERPLRRFAQVIQGDCRNLDIADASVSTVLTSPPYLNAIDYMRGHRMSLVWFGHRISDLRGVRGTSVGTERGAEQNREDDPIRTAMGPVHELPRRERRMIDRYATDLRGMMREVRRVLTTSGEATFVMGNSCLRGVYVNNAEALAAAGRLAGLEVVERFERDLPPQHRYLPLSAGTLSKRMRTETIMSLRPN